MKLLLQTSRKFVHIFCKLNSAQQNVARSLQTFATSDESAGKPLAAIIFISTSGI
jgi:hypothetical protein